MNGEIGLASRLTIAANNVLKGGERKFEKLPFENNITFIMDDKTTFSCAEEWFDWLVEDGKPSVFMMLPYEVKDRRTLGFVNASGAAIFVRRTHKAVCCFAPLWEFDKEKRCWNITFRERIMDKAPDAIPTFSDNSEVFKKVLAEIKELAVKLDFPMFADCFGEALRVLDGGEIPAQVEGAMLPELPEDRLHIYLACVISDVFGGMGSWNDSPAGAASEKQLLKEYDALSNALLAHNRIAMMYAVNG